MPRRGSCSQVLEMPLPAVEEIRIRALERLYLRREAVEELIRCLEQYEERGCRGATCVTISATRKCS